MSVENNVDYEAQRLQNIKKNNAILASLGIKGSKQKVIQHQYTKKGRSTVKLPRKRVIPQGPRRRSKRVQGIKAEPLYLPEDFREPSKDRIKYTREELPSIQGNVEVEEDGKLFFKSLQLSLKEEENVCTPSKPLVLNYAKRLSHFDVTENCIAKVTPGRAYSIDMSPDAKKTIVATGDKEGMLGIWQFSEGQSEPNIFQQQIHSDSISSLYFDRKNPAKLYSTSYDGRALIFDASKLKFTQFHVDDTLLFDLVLAKSSIFVANKNGTLSVVDERAQSSQAVYKLHENKINSVEVNPVDDNYIVTASLDRSVGVWDLRNLKKEISLIGHNLAISHAAYSRNGESIVSLCNDDLMHCFDFRDRVINDDNPEFATYRHSNKTGRWLTRFKLNFNKKLDQTFVVGSMDQPRCIEVFSIVNQKCKRIMRLRSDYVRSVQSLNVFHDQLDIIASVNSSGRVHLWM